MGEPKHTPGPWEYEPEMEHVSAQGAPVARVLTCDDFPCLDPEEHDIEALCGEYNANGLLIAAAPDLYAACRLALDVFGGETVDTTEMTEDEARRFEAILHLTAALAKCRTA